MKKLPIPSPGNLLSFFRDRDTLLVCETDGFALRGAVLRQHRGKLQVLMSHQSGATDLREAVQELVASMRASGWRGRKAILLTPGVLSTLVELPVSPDSKRPVLQMQEMIRWELEPLLMQHMTLWSVGRILQGLGHLTHEQVEEVLEVQQGRKKTSGGDLGMYSFKRFGDIAIEMGFVDRTQMDECIQRQAWLKQEGEEFACGWSSQGASDLEGGQYQWLASGANLAMMRVWESAFSSQGVALDGLYPLVGCASTLLPESSNALLIEAHAGMVCGVRLEGGVMAATRLHEIMHGGTLNACLETYHDLTPPDVDVIWFASAKGETGELKDKLAAKLGKEISDVEADGMEATPGMVGAARHAFGLQTSAKLAPVSMRGPKLPVWQRPRARAAAALALIVVGLLLAELTLQVRQVMAKAENERVSAQKAEIDAVVARVEKHNSAMNKLHDSVIAKEKELESYAKRAEFFGFELTGRTAMLQSLLEQLAGAVNEDVVLDSIIESNDGVFTVDAWSLSDSSAQQFILRVKEFVADWELQVSDVLVESKVGRLGILGYDIRFKLTEAEVAAEVAEGATSYE